MDKNETLLYDAFVDKFKPKLTTDDCYTPDNVYNAVADWVAQRYGVDRAAFVRPFWPGGDYERHEYPAGCVVVDNPPFSLISSIVRYYTAHGIRYFLFAPALTLFTAHECEPCYIPTGISITYANGASVATSFVTNLCDDLIHTEPTLYKIVERENKINEKNGKANLPKYEYPDEIVTAAMAQRWCKYGVEYVLRPEHAEFVRALDAQRNVGKSIFGSGYLLSERAAAERAAAERAAAERAAAERWMLSDREKAIVAMLGTRERRRIEPFQGEQLSLEEAER